MELIDGMAWEQQYGIEEKLNIPVVSQQSKLFFAFLKWAKQADLDYPDEMLLKDFEQFNAKNCG